MRAAIVCGRNMSCKASVTLGIGPAWSKFHHALAALRCAASRLSRWITAEALRTPHRYCTRSASVPSGLRRKWHLTPLTSNHSGLLRMSVAAALTSCILRSRSTSSLICCFLPGGIFQPQFGHAPTRWLNASPQLSQVYIRTSRSSGASIGPCSSIQCAKSSTRQSALFGYRRSPRPTIWTYMPLLSVGRSSATQSTCLALNPSEYTLTLTSTRCRPALNSSTMRSRSLAAVLAVTYGA